MRWPTDPFRELRRVRRKEIKVMGHVDDFREKELGFEEEFTCGEAKCCWQCAVKKQLLPPRESRKSEEVRTLV